MNVLFYFALLTITAGYAVARGGPDERLAAAVCIGASLASLLFLSPWTERYSSVEEGVALIDLLTLAAFLAIALRTDRFWPLWVTGLQLTSTSGHLLKLVEPGLVRFAYAAALALWSYPILLIIAVGTYRSTKRRRPASPPPT